MVERIDQATSYVQRLTTTVRRAAGLAILKFSPARYPRIAENEDFFLRMARGCGLRTPTHEVVHDVNGVSALLVTRFDRTPDGRLIVDRTQQGSCPELRALLSLGMKLDLAILDQINVGGCLTGSK